MDEGAGVGFNRVCAEPAAVIQNSVSISRSTGFVIFNE